MIYTISIIIIIISYFLFKKVAGSMALNKLNMVSIIFYYYLMFSSYIGAVFIANGFGHNPVLIRVDLEHKIFGWIVISYVMIAVPIGILISKYIFNIKSAKIQYNNYINRSLNCTLSKQDSYIKIFLYFLSLLSFFSAFYVVKMVGEIPQLKLLSLSSYIDVLTLRTTINRDFSGIYQIKSILFEQLTLLLSYISYAYYRITNSNQDRIWFYLMFFLSLFVVTFVLSKSPLVKYGITFLLLKIYIDGPIKWTHLISFFIFSLMSLILIFIVIVKGSSMEEIFTYLFNRMFFDQISSTFLMFQIFPDIYDYIGFNSLSKPLSNLFLESFSEPATRLASEYAFVGATQGGYMNLLSTLFIGEAWANFSWYGIIIAPIYIGIIIGSFYYFTLKHRKTPILVGFLTFFSFNVNFSSQFNQYIYNSTVFTLLFLFIFVYILALALKQKRKGFYFARN